MQFLTFRFLRSERDEIDADIWSDIVDTILNVNLITALIIVKIIVITFFQLSTYYAKGKLKSMDARE